MAYRILNFVEAMSLAQIVSKYVDHKTLKNMTGEEFVSLLASTASVEDIVKMETMLVGNSGEIEPMDILIACTEAMIKNNIMDLLETYKHLWKDK